MAILENVRVQWTAIQAPDTTFEHVWQTDAILTKEQADELQKQAKAINAKGIKFKKTDDGHFTYRFKRSVMKKDGSGENPAPKCVGTKKGIDGKLEPFTELVGNDSICNIQYSFYEWSNKFGNGVSADFKGLQVVKHVPYGVGDGDEFGEVDEETKSTSTSQVSDEEFDDEDFS